VLKQGAEFFEAHSTGQLMSSIMNDVDKVQVATSQILADLLRQWFTAVALLFVLFSNDWRLAAVCLIVLPAVMLPTMRIGKRIRRTSRSTQDRQGELNQIRKGIERHMAIKAFGAEQYESDQFRDASNRLHAPIRQCQRGLSSPVIDFVAASPSRVSSPTRIRSRRHAGATTQLPSWLVMLEPLKGWSESITFPATLGASPKVFEYLDHQETMPICRAPSHFRGLP
jgi:subfamily B ATP-binding cassette protein MsbA